jgi:hypothetical protein
MPLTEQLVVRASGPVTGDVLDRLRLRLRSRRRGRLGDAEDVNFGVRYLRAETDLTDLRLVREDDTSWRLELNYPHEPLPAETVAGLRADIVAAVTDVGLTVTDVWERPDQPGTARG